MRKDAQAEHYSKFIIKEYRCWTLYLHEYQNYLGRSYAWLRRDGEMQRLSKLTGDERDELFETVFPEYEEAVHTLWSPDHMNYAWLGNEIETHGGHGHMHLIPRYERAVTFCEYGFQDPRWGHNYAPYFKRNLSDDVLFKIRDVIQKELK